MIVSKVCRDHGHPSKEGLCKECIMLLAKNHDKMMSTVKQARYIVSTNAYYDRDDWEPVTFRGNHAVNFN